MLELRRPTLEDKETILEMMAEFEQSQSAHDGSFWDSKNFNYEEWLATNADLEMGLNIPQTWVPAIQYAGFVNKKAIGFLNLRLALNEHLLNQGGHIGYSVKPSARGKGYAKQLLHLGLLEAKAKNINPVLVTCHDNNPASRAVILANGGILEDSRDQIERYWIDLEEKDDLEHT